MLDRFSRILLILLIVFTPIAFGSQLVWAFSLMELGILLMIILWCLQSFPYRSPVTRCTTVNQSPVATSESWISENHSLIIIVLLALFLGLVLFQMIPLPAGMMKVISPKTYEIKSQLSVSSLGGANRSLVTSLSFFPLATKVEFFKWLALGGLFIVLLHWRLPDRGYRLASQLIITIFFVGVFESVYGMLEFFSGHRHIFYLDWSSRISSVTGTFLNRNYFAGYLLIAIPLSIGLLFSTQMNRSARLRGWRHRLSSLDGRDLILGFGLILMILGLLLSASRMGILSLLISFSVISIFFRDPRRGQRFSMPTVLILSLAVLWAVWIGLDLVVSRLFTVTEGLRSRWAIWVDAFKILKDFPLLGSGLGTFANVFPMYRSFHLEEHHTHAENDYLQLALEVGLVGIGLLLALFLLLFFKTASGIRSLPHGDPERYVGTGGLVGILALMLHSIVERNIQVPANAFLYTTVWAMVFRIANHSRRPRKAVDGLCKLRSPSGKQMT